MINVYTKCDNNEIAILTLLNPRIIELKNILINKYNINKSIYRGEFKVHYISNNNKSTIINNVSYDLGETYNDIYQSIIYSFDTNHLDDVIDLYHVRYFTNEITLQCLSKSNNSLVTGITSLTAGYSVEELGNYKLFNVMDHFYENIPSEISYNLGKRDEQKLKNELFNNQYNNINLYKNHIDTNSYLIGRIFN